MSLKRCISICCGTALVLGALAPAAMAFPGTPEIDPGSATSALALVIGGFLMATSKLRRR